MLICIGINKHYISDDIKPHHVELVTFVTTKLFELTNKNTGIHDCLATMTARTL